uniref:Uncharacterized protein n=1 Tax=Zea mays TaxID=4577 RepID=A0A804MSR1_MAIZE
MPSCYLCEIHRPAATSAHQIHANIRTQIQRTGCPRLPLSAIRVCPSLAERSMKSTPSSQRNCIDDFAHSLRPDPRGSGWVTVVRKILHEIRTWYPRRNIATQIVDLKNCAAYRQALNQVRRPRPAAWEEEEELGGATGYLAAENQDVTRQLVRAQQPVGVKCSVLAGACNLCNGGVHFVREQHPNRDVSLQIESRRELLQRSGRSPDDISSVILVEKDRSFIKSKVVLRIMEYLNLFEIHGLN